MQTSDAFPLTTAPAHKDRLSCLGEIALYAAVFLLTTLLFLIVKPLYSVERDGVVAQAITACVIGGVAFVGIFLALEKKLTARRFAVLVLVAGLALRIGYMLYTPASARQHDTFTKNFDVTRLTPGRFFLLESSRPPTLISFIILRSTHCCKRDLCTLWRDFQIACRDCFLSGNISPKNF